jgi:hypothetical protein
MKDQSKELELANANIQALAETRNAALSAALDQAAFWRAQAALLSAELQKLKDEAKKPAE